VARLGEAEAALVGEPAWLRGAVRKGTRCANETRQRVGSTQNSSNIILFRDSFLGGLFANNPSIWLLLFGVRSYNTSW